MRRETALLISELANIIIITIRNKCKFWIALALKHLTKILASLIETKLIRNSQNLHESSWT